MKSLIACVLFASVSALAACSHDAAPPQQPAPLPVATADGVDPTLPSWAPKTCKDYHTAVVKFSHCGDIALDLRDKVSAQYDADNKSWHNLTDAKQSDLDQVKLACGDQAASVTAQMSATCAEQPTTVTARP